MAEGNCTSSNGGENSRDTIRDICRDLRELQEGQSRLTEHLKSFTLKFSELIDVQNRLNAQIATLAEQSFAQRCIKPCNMPAEEPMAVADAGSLTMPTAPYPQFNAGRRLMNTSELLEMVLLELPSESILFAQRISRQFRSVITESHSLQRRLFLTTTPAVSVSENIVLNPIVTKPTTLPFIPLYFDEEKTTMAYCHRRNRKRVYCTTATVVKDETSGQQWVNLELANSHPRANPWFFEEVRQNVFDAGSWKQMCLSQPPCGVKWQLTMADERLSNWEHKYSGTFTSAPTMDTFLEAFAASAVVDEGQHRRSSRR